jgi:hypothetical protein
MVLYWQVIGAKEGHILTSIVLLGVGGDNNNPQNLDCAYGGHDHFSPKIHD